MPIQRKKEFQSILKRIKELAQEEEVGQENRAEVLKALNKLTSIFYGTKIEVDLSKLSTRNSDEDILERKTTIETTPNIIDQYESYLKVKFLLLKCKELFDLFAEYDSPTDALLKKKKAMERNLSKAVRPIQDLPQELFADGVLGEITNVLISKSSQCPPPEDVICDIVHHVSRQTQKRRRVKEKDTAEKIDKRGDLPSKRVDKNLTVEFFHNFGGCRKPDEIQDTIKKTTTDLEREVDEKELPKEIISAIYQNYPEAVADEMARLVARKPRDEGTNSCFNVVRGMIGEEEGKDKTLVEWAQEEFCAKSDDSQSSELTDSSGGTEDTEPGIRSLASRLVTPTFPRLSARKKFFRRGEEDRTETPVMKYKLEGRAERLPSNTNLFYAKEKRLNLEPTPKSKAADESVTSFMDDKIFEELDPERKERNEEIKKYMERIHFARLERLERFGYTNFINTRKNKLKEKSIKVRFPEPNFEIIKERMLLKEKQSELRRKKSEVAKKPSLG